MKKLLLWSSFTLLCFVLEAQETPPQPSQKQVVIRTVNFKNCVEKSKMGKQEQSSFDALKKQMENVLTEKEKTLNEMASKFEDPDYLDSLSAEAETELKRKFRALNQELNQLQGQYYEALKQTNFKVIQQLTDTITKASSVIAHRENIDLVLNDESAFFANPTLDISSRVVVIMDEIFEQEAANKKAAPVDGSAAPKSALEELKLQMEK